MSHPSKKLQFLFAINKAEAVLSRTFGGQGLGFSDMAVLYAIYSAPEGKIRRVDLADVVGLTASGVTRLLVPLEKIGVVKREVHERDARASYVTLTRAGKELLLDVLKWAEHKTDDLLPDGHAKDIDSATKLLQHIAK
jgi:DNA-binding MarR family transcriptional regulator